mmetsp:Transcript_8360/g.17262  ORF Transcript_8360/g.17262 Transcript_8360/m.17262 type:complete len:250 (-) Transcript_8360:187-936(-)
MCPKPHTPSQCEGNVCGRRGLVRLDLIVAGKLVDLRVVANLDQVRAEHGAIPRRALEILHPLDGSVVHTDRLVVLDAYPPAEGQPFPSLAHELDLSALPAGVHLATHSNFDAGRFGSHMLLVCDGLRWNVHLPSLEGHLLFDGPVGVLTQLLLLELTEVFLALGVIVVGNFIFLHQGDVFEPTPLGEGHGVVVDNVDDPPVLGRVISELLGVIVHFIHYFPAVIFQLQLHHGGRGSAVTLEAFLHALDG